MDLWVAYLVGREYLVSCLSHLSSPSSRTVVGSREPTRPSINLDPAPVGPSCLQCLVVGFLLTSRTSTPTLFPVRVCAQSRAACTVNTGWMLASFVNIFDTITYFCRIEVWLVTCAPCDAENPRVTTHRWCRGDGWTRGGQSLLGLGPKQDAGEERGVAPRVGSAPAWN